MEKRVTLTNGEIAKRKMEILQAGLEIIAHES